MGNKRYLLLENGTVFEGRAFGADGEAAGEVVFNTGMTGYLETLTDPSYYGQMIVQTFPLIGNYGVIPQDFESDRSFVKGYIVRDWCQEPSNFRNQGDLDTFLREQGIPGLYGIDTRALTRIVRENGVMNGMILSEKPDAQKDFKDELRNYTIENAVENTSSHGIKHFSASADSKDGKKRTIAVVDLGAKKNICKVFQQRGCDVVLVPYNTKAEEIISMKPSGIMLSNGPGDPSKNTDVIKETAKLRESGIPVFGICLGHQLLALSAGASTEKMKYGHRGANQPVKRLSDSRVFISSQNHGYHVMADSLPDFAEVSFVNVNDGSCEGIRYSDKPVFSVQFHPEAHGGPLDPEFLFDEFMDLIEEVENAAE